MNPKNLLLLVLLGTISSSGAAVTGDALNIGTGNTVTANNGAVGTTNSVSGGSSLAVGFYSSINGAGNASIGRGNYFGTNVSFSAAIGDSNGSASTTAGSGYASLVVGQGNISNGTYPYCSLVVGDWNSQIGYQAQGSLISGSNNAAGGTSYGLTNGLVAGYGNYAGDGAKFVLGVGLVSDSVNGYDLPQIVLGKLNAFPTTTDQLLIIGNGTGSGENVTLHNAIEVLQSGDINTRGGKLNLFTASGTVPAIVLDPVTSQITINGRPVLAPAANGNYAIGDSTVLSPAWKGASAAGAPGYDKVVFGALQSTYTGATIGAHNSALNSWANLNIDAANLIFRANGETETMRISGTGNVGIGTPDPQARLDVSGTSRFDIGEDPNAFVVYNGPNAENQLRVDGDQRMVLLNESGVGKVGIGTPNPISDLHIVGNAKANSDVGPTGNSNLTVEARGAGRTPGTGAAIGFVVPANTDGSNAWEQGRILVTPDNSNSGDANGRMYLQTRYNSPTAWAWRDNIVLSSNGGVSIPKRQGDVGMGRFGNTGDQ